MVHDDRLTSSSGVLSLPKPGKSGASLERVAIGGERYILKHLDLADDWTMRASGCLRGAPLTLWERGVLARLPDCFNQPIVGAAPEERPGPPPSGGCALLMRDVTLGNWQRRNARGAFLYLDGLEGVKGMYVLEVPSGGATNPEKHIYDEFFLVIEGRQTVKGGQLGDFPLIEGFVTAHQLRQFHIGAFTMIELDLSN